MAECRCGSVVQVFFLTQHQIVCSYHCCSSHCTRNEIDRSNSRLDEKYLPVKNNLRLATSSSLLRGLAFRAHRCVQ